MEKYGNLITRQALIIVNGVLPSQLASPSP